MSDVVLHLFENTINLVHLFSDPATLRLLGMMPSLKLLYKALEK